MRTHGSLRNYWTISPRGNKGEEAADAGSHRAGAQLRRIRASAGVCVCGMAAAQVRRPAAALSGRIRLRHERQQFVQNTHAGQRSLVYSAKYQPLDGAAYRRARTPGMGRPAPVKVFTDKAGEGGPPGGGNQGVCKGSPRNERSENSHYVRGTPSDGQ